MGLRPTPQRGQTIAEYALLFVVITTMLIAIQAYIKRSVQATVKVASDRMGPRTLGADPEGEHAQRKGMRYESGDRTNRVFAEGTPLERFAASKTTSKREIEKTLGLLEGDAETRTIEDITETRGAVTDPDNLAVGVAKRQSDAVKATLQRHRRFIPSLDPNTVSAYSETVVRVRDNHPASSGGSGSSP